MELTDPDVVTIHRGSVVNREVRFHTSCIADGTLHIGRVTVGRHCVVEPAVVLNPYAAVPHGYLCPALATVGGWWGGCSGANTCEQMCGADGCVFCVRECRRLH